MTTFYTSMTVTPIPVTDMSRLCKCPSEKVTPNQNDKKFCVSVTRIWLDRACSIQ